MEHTLFRIVADIVHITVQACHLTKSSQNKSIPWTHAFAVKNRTNPDRILSYDKPQMHVTDLEMQHMLPSESDQEELHSDLVPLVYREIVKYMHSYAPFKAGVQQHISHPHSKDMSRKSKQVLFISIVVH